MASTAVEAPRQARAPMGLLRSPALVCAGLATVLAALYVATQPRVGDFAAQVYRTELFGRSPFAVWDGNWYAGHHLPGYSVLFPPLGWLLGPALLAALAAVVAAALFGALVEEGFGPAARPGGWWFATLGVGSQLFAGRLTFILGVAFGLGTLLALQRGRSWASAGLCVATALASPLAALFLAMALVAWRRGVLAAVALLAGLVLVVLFPEGGSEPLYRAYLVTTLGMTVAAALVIPRRAPRAIFVGVALYACGIVAAYYLSTPVGSNVGRVGGLFAGPLLACLILDGRVSMRWRAPLAAVVSVYALWHFPPWYELGALVSAGLLAAGLARRSSARGWAVGVVVGLAPFAVWQWSQTALDLSHATDDPGTHAAYFRPLIAFLERADRPRVWRVEVPPMREHWESVELAEHFPLARGWERQLDRRDASLFYRPHSWRHYRAWLNENVVRWVAVPDAPLDYATERELAAIRYRAPYLRPVWHSAHWRVYEVTPRPRLVVPGPGAEIRARSLAPTAVTLAVRRPGTALVRVRYTRYWRLRRGCVSRAGDWTRIRATRPGLLKLTISVTPARLLPWAGARCG